MTKEQVIAGALTITSFIAAKLVYDNNIEELGFLEDVIVAAEKSSTVTKAIAEAKMILIIEKQEQAWEAAQADVDLDIPGHDFAHTPEEYNALNA